MDIQKGNLSAHFISGADPSWRVFFRDVKVAECKREDWDNTELDFMSKEAGQALIDTMGDMYDHLFITASEEVEAAMHKTDDGNVENVDKKHEKDEITNIPASTPASEIIESVEKTPTDSGCCGQCAKPPGHAPCDSKNVEDVVTKSGPEHFITEDEVRSLATPDVKLKSLLEALKNLMNHFHSGGDKEREAVVKEASTLFARARLARLVNQAEILATVGEDNTHTLSKIAAELSDEGVESEDEAPDLNEHVATLSLVDETSAKRVIATFLSVLEAIGAGVLPVEGIDTAASILAQAVQEGLGGATENYGETSDQEYSNNADTGEDLAGEDSQDDGEGHKLHDGEQDVEHDPFPEKLVHASSNKPCGKCGAPTDSGTHQNNCMEAGPASKGNNPQRTEDAMKRQREKQYGSSGGTKGGDAFSQVLASDSIVDRMVKAGYVPDEFLHLASHVDEISFSASTLGIDSSVDYWMSGRMQELTQRVDKHLREKFKNTPFTIVRLAQDGSGVKVYCLVFDRALDYSASLNDTNSETSHIGNNDGIHQTAYRKRMTALLGGDDSLGYVACPIESNHLTRSCGTCPFASNASTYIQDGAVNCHFDEGHVWLNGLGVHESRPSMNNSR